MKLFMRNDDDLMQNVVDISLAIMALTISLNLFVQFINDFTTASALTPTNLTPLFVVFLQSKLFLFLLGGIVLIYSYFIFKCLMEVYLAIMAILELIVLLRNRPAHLKGKK